jgi:predicted DNA-binding antitoxin AbrB/MazE fold protein
MTTVEATYEGGVFKPTTPVALPEHQAVRLIVEPIEPVPPEDLRQWLAALRKRHDEWLATRPPLPDSTPDIAADRRRDV